MSDEQARDGAVENTGTQPETSLRPSPRPGMGAAAGLFWALIGGMAAFALVVAFDPVFGIPEELRCVTMNSPPDVVAAHEAAMEKAYLQNGALILAQLGFLVGGLMALGEGVAQRSALRALRGLCLGAVAGAAFAVLGGFLGLQAMDFYTARYGEITAETELARTVLVQAVMLGTMGGGIGLGLGILRRQSGGLVSAILGGVLGGVLAGMLYPFLAAKLLPDNTTEHLIPRGDHNRLLWIGLSAVLVGLTVPGMTLSRRRRS